MGSCECDHVPFIERPANNDVNSVKHLEEKINEPHNENKQLKDDNRTLSEILKLIHENKCIPVSKSSTDYDTNKWEANKSRRNKTNKSNGDPESVGAMNKFQPLFYS